jgi:peroxiredoxin family protein
MLAAILESGEPTRLYTALSLLVSTAAEGEPARGLASFGALAVLLADPVDGDDPFTRTLAELRRTAAEMDGCEIYACAAAVETTGVDRAEVQRKLDGVMSTPRFLRETAGARLVVV